MPQFSHSVTPGVDFEFIPIGSLPYAPWRLTQWFDLDSNELPRIVCVWDIDWEYIPCLKHAWFDGAFWQVKVLNSECDSQPSGNPVK